LINNTLEKLKIKLNWPTGIVIAIISFMIFILSFVYKSIAVDKYQHELVSEDYYKDELHYQEEINKLNNARTLKKDVELINSSEGILIKFPENIEGDQVKGTISFQRLSNKKLDFVEEIHVKGHEQLIPGNKIVSGKWIVKIEWQNGDEEYLFKESWFY